MNIDIKKHLKKLIAIGSLSLVLVTTGCSSKENNAEPENIVTTETENNNEQKNTTNTNNTQETENNNETIDPFSSEREEIDSIIYTENFELLDEVYGDYLIDAIDFIRGEKTYQDTKFSDLNKETQQKIINDLIETTNKVESINPNWQEDVENIKGSAVEAYYNVLESIENLIGTENYNNIGDLINSIIDGGKDIGSSLGDSFNNWLDGYKNSHQK